RLAQSDFRGLAGLHHAALHPIPTCVREVVEAPADKHAMRRTAHRRGFRFEDIHAGDTLARGIQLHSDEPCETRAVLDCDQALAIQVEAIDALHTYVRRMWQRSDFAGLTVDHDHPEYIICDIDAIATRCRRLWGSERALRDKRLYRGRAGLQNIQRSECIGQ